MSEPFRCDSTICSLPARFFLFCFGEVDSSEHSLAYIMNVPLVSLGTYSQRPDSSVDLVSAAAFGELSSTNPAERSLRAASLLLKQPDDELFHCMISYRVSTDAAIARALHDGLHFKTLNAKKKLDFYAVSKFPRGFNRAADCKQSWLNIFLDKVCLRTGKDWADEGFIPALLCSLTVVPLLSWTTAPPDLTTPTTTAACGSIGQLAQHNCQSVDNVLLELILTKELHETWKRMSKHADRFENALFPCMHIIPIFIQDLFGNAAKLTDAVPIATLDKASEVLRGFGIETDASFKSQSIKSIVSFFTRLQGIKYYDLGNSDSANEQTVGRLWDSLKVQALEFDIDNFRLSMFAQNNPHGSELLEFLMNTESSHLSRFLVKHGISSVSSLAGLHDSETAVSLLAQETSKALKLPLTEQLLTLKMVSKKAMLSPLASPLQLRLSNFSDTEASVLTAIYSSFAFDIMYSKPIFRWSMFAIGVIYFAIATLSLLQSGPTGAITLYWMGFCILTSAVLSQFLAPRWGRYWMTAVFCGASVLHTVGFVVNYFTYARGAGSFAFAPEDNQRLISSRSVGEFAKTYQFLSFLLVFSSVAYSLLFRQEQAWRFMMATMLHYEIFLIVMNETMILPPGPTAIFINSFTGVLCFVLLLVTETARYLAVSRAKKLVMSDLIERRSQWTSFKADGTNARTLERLDALLCSGKLSACCEKASEKTGNLIAIKVSQPHKDIERLYHDAALLNYFFQDWVKSWFNDDSDTSLELCNPKYSFKEIFKIRIPDCAPEVLRGPIKSPRRSISKVRSSDIFRQSCAFANNRATQ